MWYTFLNIFFFVFHTVFTLFNMGGWAFPKTRKLHLITLSLTAFSWFILGIWYGWGFCFVHNGIGLFGANSDLRMNQIHIFIF